MIVIPMAGMSRRFFDAGYSRPKYELPLDGQTLFGCCLRSFEHYFGSERFVFVHRHAFGADDFIARECDRLGLDDYLAVGLGGALLDIPIAWRQLPLLAVAVGVGTAGWFFFYAIFALRIRRNDAFNTVTSILYFVFLFASSMFYPLDPLPTWLRLPAEINPVTWQVDVLRFASVGLGDPQIAPLLLLPPDVAHRPRIAAAQPVVEERELGKWPHRRDPAAVEAEGEGVGPDGGRSDHFWSG